jgi:hypothetical protein
MDGAMNAVSRTTAIGHGAASSLTQGDDGVYIGYNAGQSVQTGQRNLAIGSAAYDAASGDTQDNIAIGYSALGDLNHNSSVRNIAIGNYAGDGMGTLAGSIDNVFMGYGAGGGSWTTAVSSYNVGIGNYVMDAVMNGAAYNVGVGYNALSGLTTGNLNNAFGTSAAQFLTTGQKNVMVGYGAGFTTTDVDRGIFIGHEAASEGDITSAADVPNALFKLPVVKPLNALYPTPTLYAAPFITASIT